MKGILDPCTMKGPIKSPFSVCPAVHQFGVFLRSGSLVLSNFLHNGRYLEYLKTDRKIKKRQPIFPGKFIFT